MTTDARKAHTMAVMSSSKDMTWPTPQGWFDGLDREFGFTLDPCCTEETAKCRRFYTPETDGLAHSWRGERVFMNPPYGREIGVWMRKAHEEHKAGALVVCFVPARVDTKWWHDYATKATEIRFPKGRVKNPDGGSWPFPVAIIIFNPSEPCGTPRSIYLKENPTMTDKKQQIDPVAVLDDCAERMESIAVALRSLAACFPSASSKGGSSSDDEPTAKPSRTKAAKAPELTQAVLRGQLKALTDVHGAEAVTHVLSLVGVGRLPDVDSEHYEELAGHISDLIEGKTKLPGKKKAAAPEGPDYQDLEDRFRAVLKADTAKAKAIVTALKLKKFSEIDQENPKAMAKAEQLISEAEGTDEDDMI